MFTFNLKHLAIGAVAFALTSAVHAQIVGFGTNGTGWSLQGGATVNSNDLHLTQGQGNSTSAFFNTVQGINSWDASFTWTNNTGPGGAFDNPGDGMVFTLQNAGPTAVGFGGGDLGFVGIPNATGVAFDLWIAGGPGTGLANSSVPYNYMSTNPVDFRSTHPILVDLTYGGSMLNETVTDAVTHATFSTSYNVNVASLVGGSTAYVGFTGGTGGAEADQHITNFSFHSVPDSGSTIGLFALALASLIGARRKFRLV